MSIVNYNEINDFMSYDKLRKIVIGNENKIRDLINMYLEQHTAIARVNYDDNGIYFKIVNQAYTYPITFSIHGYQERNPPIMHLHYTEIPREHTLRRNFWNFSINRDFSEYRVQDPRGVQLRRDQQEIDMGNAGFIAKLILFLLATKTIMTRRQNAHGLDYYSNKYKKYKNKYLELKAIAKRNSVDV